MRIAIAQLNPTVGNVSSNRQTILEIAQDVAHQGVRILLTPELSLCGYPPRDLLLDPSWVETMAVELQHLATALPPQLLVLVGVAQANPAAAQRGQKPLFNSMACLAAGGVQQVVHKRLLPTYDVFDEDRYFTSGTEPGVITVDGVRLGVTICEDHWNDEQFWGQRSYAVNPIAELAAAEVDLMVNLSASPFVCGKQQLREAMLRDSAQRYGCGVVSVNQVGGNDDLIFDGRSVVFDAQGTLVGRAAAFASDVLILEFDPSKKALTKTAIAPAVADRNAEIWAALVLGVRDYARKCGFRQAVLGLSGGIDSALVGAIATAALGPAQVLGVLMPSPFSSDHSITDAQQLAHNLGIQTTVLAIDDLMAGYDQILADLFMGTEPGVTEENIQARIRGNLLMAIANKFGRLLISTGNKSEMAVGYCTLYGDMSGGLAAISDVPKTQVYALCHWLNTETGRLAWQQAAQMEEVPARIIPDPILTKPPSAELRPGQLDQDSLPDYEILDDILARLIDQHQSMAQIIATGYDRAIVERVIQLVKRAEFKRRQAPTGLKITDRAFGTGWRMPIAAQVSLPS